MAKKHQSLAQNKNVGHLVALCFYMAVGYFLYIAASNMNYVWKWNSIPDYFVYTETKNVEAPANGKLIIEDGSCSFILSISLSLYINTGASVA